MKANEFELIGRLNFIEFKATESGTVICRLLISKKAGEDKYDSYGVTLFNEDAERCEKFEKGNYVHVTGRLTINKFTDKNGNNREEIRLVGSNAEVVTYDNDSKSYVSVTNSEKKPWE